MSSRPPQQQQSTTAELGPLLTAILAAGLFLFAFPALIVGTLAYRLTARKRWSLPLWFLLLWPGAFALYYLYTHGLQELFTQQMLGVVASAQRHQWDLQHWNIPLLWQYTWPVWLRTLVGIPIVGFWQEIGAQARPAQTSKLLKERERRRQRAISQAQTKAKKRTRLPDQVPDTIGGLMVIGVPITEIEEEE